MKLHRAMIWLFKLLTYLITCLTKGTFSLFAVLSCFNQSNLIVFIFEFLSLLEKDLKQLPSYMELSMCPQLSIHHITNQYF